MANRNLEIAPSFAILQQVQTSLIKCFARGVYQNILNRFESIQIQIFRNNPALLLNKSKHDLKGIAPSFESHFKEPNRNFEIASSLEIKGVHKSFYTNRK